MTSPSGGNQYQQESGAPGTPHGPKITSIFDFSSEALEALAFWIEQRGLHIPIAQVLGFSQFTAQTATFVATSETISSSTYGDLATVGPTLTNIPDGQYLVMFGCASAIAATGAGKEAAMSIMVNSTAVDDADACVSQVGSLVSVANLRSKTLSNGGNNTITAKYRSLDNVTVASFARRWLIALRFANS